MRKDKEIAATATETGTRKSAPADAPPTDLSPDDVARVHSLIDQIEALIPGFAPYDIRDARRVGNVARFAKDLIPQMIDTVTALPDVIGTSAFDAVEGKAALEFDRSTKPIVQRLSALLDGVQFTSDSRLARSAGRALATYAWAKKHVKGPEGIELRPYLDDMALTMKRTLNRRRKPAKPSPTQAPKGAQGFLAPNLAAVKPVDDDNDLPEDFRKQLEEAVKD